jgi:hypothetical protein
LLLLSACSATLLTRDDYAPSLRALSGGDLEGARVSLPRGEEGGFITTMEKTYLALLQGRPEIDALARQAAALDEQVRYHVSREAKTFFYVHTAEDYYASEHEIVWMHLLLSWGYSLRGEAEKACVEARIAGSLLDLPHSPTGRFDDPALRLFLAGLWAMCGEWREAQVDFRAAWGLDNSLAWAKELADRTSTPAHLFIVLGGPGPDVYWNPASGANPLRSGRQMGFRFRGKKSELEIADAKSARLQARRSPDAAPWYERHLVRNNEIHELIKDSHYAKDIVVHGGVATAKIGASTAAGIAVGVGGVIIGAVIVKVAGESGSGEGVALGLSIAAAGIAKGMEIAQSGYRESTREMQERIDPSPGYRYVRFLPDYLWVAWSDEPFAYPAELRTSDWVKRSIGPITRGRPSVSIAYLPDVPLASRRGRGSRY